MALKTIVCSVPAFLAVVCMVASLGMAGKEPDWQQVACMPAGKTPNPDS